LSRQPHKEKIYFKKETIAAKKRLGLQPLCLAEVFPAPLF